MEISLANHQYYSYFLKIINRIKVARGNSMELEEVDLLLIDSILKAIKENYEKTPTDEEKYFSKKQKRTLLETLENYYKNFADGKIFSKERQELLRKILFEYALYTFFHKNDDIRIILGRLESVGKNKVISSIFIEETSVAEKMKQIITLSKKDFEIKTAEYVNSMIILKAIDPTTNLNSFFKLLFNLLYFLDNLEEKEFIKNLLTTIRDSQLLEKEPLEPLTKNISMIRGTLHDVVISRDVQTSKRVLRESLPTMKRFLNLISSNGNNLGMVFYGTAIRRSMTGDGKEKDVVVEETVSEVQGVADLIFRLFESFFKEVEQLKINGLFLFDEEEYKKEYINMLRECAELFNPEQKKILLEYIENLDDFEEPKMVAGTGSSTSVHNLCLAMELHSPRKIARTDVEQIESSDEYGEASTSSTVKPKIILRGVRVREIGRKYIGIPETFISPPPTKQTEYRPSTVQKGKEPQEPGEGTVQPVVQRSEIYVTPSQPRLVVLRIEQPATEYADSRTSVRERCRIYQETASESSKTKKPETSTRKKPIGSETSVRARCEMFQNIIDRNAETSEHGILTRRKII